MNEQERVVRQIVDNMLCQLARHIPAQEYSSQAEAEDVRIVIKAFTDYGNARYAEGVEASAKVAVEHKGEPIGSLRDCHIWQMGIDDCQEAIRSLLPTQPTTKPQGGR